MEHKKDKQPTIKYLNERTQIPFPTNSDVLFVKEVAGLQSEIIYIKLRMIRDDWITMLKNPLFRSVGKDVTSNVFFGSKEVYKGWEPQRIKKSISGLLNVNDTIIVRYLFDISNASLIESYFAIGIQ